MPPNVYEFFSCLTKLPIDLDTVCDQACEYRCVDEFRFAEVDIDLTVLLGMLQMFQENGPSGESRKIARVLYSSHIRDNAMRRLVCCKEILHVFDSDDATARSLKAVDELIESIVVPPTSGIPSSVWSDHSGSLHALMVLLPRDALVAIRPIYQDGGLSVEDVARLADIPAAYARVALSPLWSEILDKIQ